ncbi:MAG: DUF63 family protein [Candidatus Thermoplasmatota archaeon]
MTDATIAPQDDGTPGSAPTDATTTPAVVPDPSMDPPASSAPVDGASSPQEPGLLDALPLWTVPAILIGVPLLVALLAKVSPSFFDEVIWQYYWGPIKADAENVARLTRHGIVAHSGYNVVNTLSWAVLLGVCILGIAQMLRHYRTPMDSRLILGATSWVVVGSAAHVLEDTGLFATPLQYFFITPPIYLLFGAFGVGAFLLGQWLKGVAERRGLHAALRLLWVVHMVLVIAWLGFWLKPWDQITVYVNPLWVAGIAVVSFLSVRQLILRKGAIDPTQLCLTLSIGTYLLVIAYIVSFLREPWMEPSPDAIPWSAVLAPLLALAVMVAVWKAPRKAILGVLFVGGSLAAGVLALYLLKLIAGVILGDRLGFAFGDRIVDNLHGWRAGAVIAIGAGYVAYRWWVALKPRLAQVLADMDPAYGWGINLLIVFGQMTDAFATSFGIDLGGYDEKHVLSAGIIDEFRDFSVRIGFDFGAENPTFIAFVAVKLLVSLLVIFAIDVYSKEDAKTNPTLIGLVKFAIIMVGLGPGVRDFTRLSLGV